MKNLEKLKKEIRSKIPELMELKERCLIKGGLHERNYLILGDLPNTNGILTLCLDTKQFHPIYQSDLKAFEIIGAEPQLNDVLRWLKITRIDSEIQSVKELISVTFLGTICRDWDLSKPLLKDQSQELIDALAGFIE